QLVELCLAIVLRPSPLALDPSLFLETMQGRVQRPFAHLEDVISELLDPSRDGISMRGSPGKRLEHQQVECALQEVELCTRHESPRMSMGRGCCPSNRMSRGSSGSERRGDRRQETGDRD